MSGRWGAYDAPRWANQQRVGSVGPKSVLMLLAAYADEEFSCYPGQQRIADETEQSVSTVRRQLKFLEALGLFHRERRYSGQSTRKTDRYFLHLDVTVTVADVERLEREVEARTGDVVEGGFPQVSAPAAPLPVSVTGSGVSAGQALPVNLTGSAHYRSNGAPLPVTGDRLELLEELLDEKGFSGDLTREPVSPELSTGSGRPERPASADSTDEALAAIRRILGSRSRTSAADRGPLRPSYLERTTAFVDRRPHPTEEPDATP